MSEVKQSAGDATLYSWSEAAAQIFFNDPTQQTYLNSFGKTF